VALQSLNTQALSNGVDGFLWGDYEALTAAGNLFYGVFCGQSIGRALVQFDPIFFQMSAVGPGIQVPSPPTFAASCKGETQTSTLNVCNTSTTNLVVTSITSSNAEFTIVSPSAGMPVTISHDFCFPFQVTFTPAAEGIRTSDLTIVSDDAVFPTLHVAATAKVGQPAAVTVVSDSGNFGELCPGRSKDLAVTINNRGSCPLLVSTITSSSPEFQVPQVSTLPIKVGAGDSIVLPVRFVPASAVRRQLRVLVVEDEPLLRWAVSEALASAGHVAAQAGAMDPAEAAVARMPGGAADAPGANTLPEFRVVRLRGLDGACQ
jgi:hypothetical protein